MSEPASISTGIATRYATAVFELARESGALDTLDANVDALDTVLRDSADFNDLIKSPVYGREAQEGAIAAIAAKMGLSELMVNTLRLMASKRRLFVLPQLVGALRALISKEKGEVVAEVTAARELSAAQQSKLVDTLKAKLGQTVKLKIRVDEALIGGLVVKVGSKMIDTSISSKLAALQNTMKEVG